MDTSGFGGRWTAEELWPEGKPAWCVEAEQHWGAFGLAWDFLLENGRTVGLMRFERAWRVVFVNPANPIGKQELDCFLTQEALEALAWLAAKGLGTEEPGWHWPGLHAMLERMDAHLEETEVRHDDITSVP